MSFVNLRDLVESAAHKWYKDNEKESMRAKWGRSYNWKELTKEIDWRSLRFVINGASMELFSALEFVTIRSFIRTSTLLERRRITFSSVRHFSTIPIVNSSTVSRQNAARCQRVRSPYSKGTPPNSVPRSSSKFPYRNVFSRPARAFVESTPSSNRKTSKSKKNYRGPSSRTLK